MADSESNDGSVLEALEHLPVVEPGTCTFEHIEAIRYAVERGFEVQQASFTLDAALEDGVEVIETAKRIIVSLHSVIEMIDEFLHEQEAALRDEDPREEAELSFDDFLESLNTLAISTEVREFMREVLQVTRLRRSSGSKETKYDTEQLALQAQESCKCEMGGEAFLKALTLSGGADEMRTSAHENKLADLCYDVQKAFGQNYAAEIHLLYYALDKDIIVLYDLVYAQCGLMEPGARKHPDANPEKFFEYVLQYVGAYADVSTDVYPENSTAHIHNMSRCAAVLQRVLHRASELPAHALRSSSDSNLHTLTAQCIEEKSDPWITCDLTATMYSRRNLHRVFSVEIQRRAVSGVFLRLNSIQTLKNIEERDSLVAKYKTLTTRKDKKGTRSIPYADQRPFEAEVDVLLKNLGLIMSNSDYAKIFDPGRKVHPSHEPPTSVQTDDSDDDIDMSFLLHGDDNGSEDEDDMYGMHTIEDPSEVAPLLDDDDDTFDPLELETRTIELNKIPEEAPLAAKITFLEKLHLDDEITDPYQLISMPDPEAGDIPPQHILLRLIDPRKIVETPELQQDFVALCDSIRTYLQTHTAAVSGKYGSRYAILARSIQMVLHSGDSYLRRPLNTLKGSSIFEELASIAFEFLDEETLRHGPLLTGDGERSGTPVVPMVDGDSMDESRVLIENNFDIGAEGPKSLDRIRIVNEAGFEGQGTAYEKAEANATQAAKRHFRAPSFVFQFYNSATAAFTEYASHAFPDLKRKDHAVIFDGQYARLLPHFAKRPGGVRAVQTNHIDRLQGTVVPKSEQELKHDTLSKLRGENSKLFLFCLLNRLGDSPNVGANGSNIFTMGNLITDMRQRMFESSGLESYVEMHEIMQVVYWALQSDSHSDKRQRRRLGIQRRSFNKLYTQMELAQFDSLPRGQRKSAEIAKELAKKCMSEKSSDAQQQADEFRCIAQELSGETNKSSERLRRILPVVEWLEEALMSGGFEEELDTVQQLKASMQRVRYFPGANDTRTLRGLMHYAALRCERNPRVHVADRKQTARWLHETRERIDGKLHYMAIAQDDAQLFGRGMGSPLGMTNPDCVIATGMKAGECGQVATIGYDPNYLKWLADRGQKVVQANPTVDPGCLGAFAIAMTSYQSKLDLVHIEGNLGEQRSKPKGRKIEERFDMLTDHVRTRAAEFGPDFCKHLLPDRKDEISKIDGVEHVDKFEDWEDLFGCRVIYPLPDRMHHDRGAIMLQFKSMNARILRDKLHDKGILSGVALHEDDGLRITLCDNHKPEHIDRLFGIISDIVYTHFCETISSGKSLRYNHSPFVKDRIPEE